MTCYTPMIPRKTAKPKCPKCGTKLKVAVITNDVAYLACPRCNPKVFEKKSFEMQSRREPISIGERISIRRMVSHDRDPDLKREDS